MANQPTKYRKFVVGAASAALVASAVAPVASAKDFSDTKGNTHEAAIDALSDANIISGYEDGSFKPNKTLTRSDVVKLMGKWLVSEGYEVPSDYKTNPRFSDLTSASNDELLKYAAVVKDNGVFNGSNGRLLAGDNITRENMAVVLVRAFDTVNDFNLVEYVGAQDFKQEVTDRNAAKAEARTAIDVLDFFDITTVATFNPKDTTTRGHFASFLHRALNTDFSAVTGVVAGVASINAVNNTTVEVKFVDAVEDLAALNFKIDGLEITNKAIKQTDAKTVVLTTAVHEAGKVYTVTANDNKLGTFTGVSAVVPTGVSMVKSAVQGKLGQEVTVQAQVTVPEGASKAGIPVTFYVPGNNDAVYPTLTAEALTNADGVATYSYTRYAAGTDSVTAYATGDRSKFSIGYVFWGVDTILAIEEVTEGSTINNGANKTYKVTYKNATTGKPEANRTFNVGFLENMNVTADKLANATVNGLAVKQLSNGTALEAAQITTDSKGEATFTVSGVNAEVTPVVYALNPLSVSESINNNKTYKASALQATAPKVKFAAVQAEYTIDITRDGGEVAATDAENGREYLIVVKDKNGNLAKNETVNVAFNEVLDRVISTNTRAKFVNPDTEEYYPVSGTGNRADQISVKTNDKGEASFIIGSDFENDYATPIAWIDINSANAKQGSLDEGEPKTVAAITHFQAPYLDGAKLVAKKNGTVTSKFDGNDEAVFSAQLVNQSGKVFTNGYALSKVTYTVFNTGAEDVKVGTTIISPNRSETFTTNGEALVVKSAEGKTTSVRVVATGTAYKDGKDFAFTAKEATATFTNSKIVAAPYTGYAVEFNPANTGANSNSLWFADKNPIKYTGTGVKYYGANGNEIFGEVAWEDYLTSLVGRDVQISYSKDGDNTIFKVISVEAGTNSYKLKKHVPTPVNNAPVDVAEDVTYLVNSTERIAITSLATDEDNDNLSFSGVLSSSDANVATVAISGGNLVITTGATTGTSTIKVGVTDGKDAVVVEFEVEVKETDLSAEFDRALAERIAEGGFNFFGGEIEGNTITFANVPNPDAVSGTGIFNELNELGVTAVTFSGHPEISLANEAAAKEAIKAIDTIPASVTLKVTDENGNTIDKVFTIKIQQS